MNSVPSPTVTTEPSVGQGGGHPAASTDQEHRPITDWLPDTEDRLRHLLDQGLLAERHTLDVKRELPPGRAANKDLAKHLAQFAPDGGVLVCGIDEGDATTPPRLAPVKLAGLPGAHRPGRRHLD